MQLATEVHLRTLKFLSRRDIVTNGLRSQSWAEFEQKRVWHYITLDDAQALVDKVLRHAVDNAMGQTKQPTTV